MSMGQTLTHVSCILAREFPMADFTDQALQGRFSAITWLVSALMPTRRDPERQRLDAALERLAETSPHLLSDMGFRPRPGTSGSVYCNGRSRVDLPRPAKDMTLRAGRG